MVAGLGVAVAANAVGVGAVGLDTSAGFVGDAAGALVAVGAGLEPGAHAVANRANRVNIEMTANRCRLIFTLPSFLSVKVTLQATTRA